MTTVPARILGRYDADALDAGFARVGVYEKLAARGFGDFHVRIERTDLAPPHVLVAAAKDGREATLIDAIVSETTLMPSFLAERGMPIDRPVELAVVHWLREEDPTAEFSASRPALPLQNHPGLGILRRAFRLLVQLATDAGKDGIASAPKYFHDAVIFYRSRLFLFLDPAEQGRFEALLRDLETLPLGDASLALAASCVRDVDGRAACWRLQLQVFPISPTLTAYFHAPAYAAQVDAARNGSRFTCDVDAVADARRSLAACGTAAAPAP